jgi:hypothetical protein
MEVLSLRNNNGFIDANTLAVDIPILQEQTIIPAFAKDNESTISHADFVESIYEVVNRIFPAETIANPSVKVSHPIKGRIPQAKGKPAKDLMEHEKTLYYERMAFMIEVPSVQAQIGNDKVSLSVGGVRAYNLENLYNKKSPERFKLFIGFKNWVCTNLCVSTDGFKSDMRVSSVPELMNGANELFGSFRIDQSIKNFQSLKDYSLNSEEFAHIIGRAKQYLNLPKELKSQKAEFPLGDSQLSQMVRAYYNLGNEVDIDLWDFYNLMTGANKSSYIDSAVDRVVDSHTFTLNLAHSMENRSHNWYL